jgi:hypothetical protein
VGGCRAAPIEHRRQIASLKKWYCEERTGQRNADQTDAEDTSSPLAGGGGTHRVRGQIPFGRLPHGGPIGVDDI